MSHCIAWNRIQCNAKHLVMYCKPAVRNYIETCSGRRSIDMLACNLIHFVLHPHTFTFCQVLHVTSSGRHTYTQIFLKLAFVQQWLFTILPLYNDCWQLAVFGSEKVCIHIAMYTGVLCPTTNSNYYTDNYNGDSIVLHTMYWHKWY